MPADRPIRILRIIARLNIGGPAIQAVSLTHFFSNKGYKTVLVCGKVDSSEGDMGYLAKEKGVTPYYIPELGREISFYGDFKSFVKLRRIIKQFDPDIIHTHTAKAGSLGRLAVLSLLIFHRRRYRHIKLVHTFHGHVFHSYFNKIKTSIFVWIERFLSRFTNRIITVSPLQKKDICHHYQIADPKKVSVIPLGFDLTHFSGRTDDREQKRRYLSHDSDSVLLVGIIGRLTQVKNHRMFLNAIRFLKSLEKERFFKFIIVGDGALRQELKDYSIELGIQDLVFFTGWQRDMPSLYSALDIVVLTSFNEGTPVTLIEAMAAGKPVIATDVGGVRDLFSGIDGKKDPEGYELARNGILIPSGKSAILANALLFIRENRAAALTMSQYARDFVLKRYSMQRLVNDMESLYSELI
jgi:glycosyltransferase involved in cell wall biosynthesis